MLRFFKSFFSKKNEPAEPVPYKVETPVVTPIMVPPVSEPVKCGCGRSASGFCVGLHKLTPDEWASHTDNPKKVTLPAAKVPAKKAPAKKKPAAIKASASPKAPRKPKAK
jgi:hypothetical protein